ncbi:MAG: transporter substrate-binding domain-containing protein [Pseudomonadota bacterium]
MVRFRIATTVFSLSILSIGPALAQDTDAVTLATKGNFPPWNFVNDAGDLDGFEHDLGEELCQRADLHCKWVFNEWATIIPNLVAGDYDAIISGMAITPERAETISFTQAYTPPAPSYYMALSEEADLSGGTIAAQTGTIQAGYLEETGANLVEHRTHDDTIAAVENGEAVALLANISFLETVGGEKDHLIIVGDPIMLGNGVGMGIRQSDGDLREKLDAAITSMKEDGSLNALIAKWDVANQW